MLLIEHRINTASIYHLLWKVSYRYLWDNMLIMTKKLSITKNFPLNALWKDLHNAFAILGRCRQALARARRLDLWNEFHKEATSGDYNHLLTTVCDYFEVDYFGEDEED